MSIKTIAWNAQSLNNKKSELTQYIEKNDIKIILISETWLSTSSSINIPHFSLYRADRSHGGVCIFIHKSISHTFFKQISTHYAEAIFIKIHCPRGDITVGSIYCSPSASRIQAKEFFQKALNISGPVIIAGDFNAKHKAWNNNKFDYKGIDLFNLCSKSNFEIHGPNGPTLIPSRGNPSAVDLVICKSILGLDNPMVDNSLSSDHCPIQFRIPINPTRNDIRIFNYSKADWKMFREILTDKVRVLNKDLPCLNSSQLVDDCISQFVTGIHEAMDRAIPKKLPYKYKYPYSKTLHILTKERNFYRNKFLRTGNPSFKSAKNQLDRLIKLETVKLNHKSFNDKIASLDTKDLSLYQFAKYFKCKSSGIPPLKNKNSELVYSDKDKADTLAEAFLSCHLTSFHMASVKENAVKKAVAKVEREKISIKSSETISELEVKEAVFELKARKAPGPDSIPNFVIQAFPDTARKLMTRIFNDCLKISYFPSEWKIGKVIAIPKPGKDKEIPTNYRPISLLSTIGKVFEKLILSRLKLFENENNLFIPNQFGFRNEHSTIQQALRIVERASKGFNTNKSTGMVLLDIEKAFDSVWHDGLVFKLNALKFPPYLVKLAKSYLADRKAFVNFQGSNSKAFIVPAGVPQGSILAPFFFNIFINDVVHPKKCELHIYADDTAIVCQASWKNLNVIKKRLKNALQRINEFFLKWKIKINDSKTEFIVFTKSTAMIKLLKENPPLYGGHNFTWQDSVKYLGVTLDTKLNFRKHIDLVCKRANKTISILFPIFKKNSSASLKSKLVIYRSYIRPVLTYAGTVYQNCPLIHFKRLQILQNKCLRMALSAPYDTRISYLHEKSKIPTIREFVSKNADKFYEKVKCNENPLIKPLGDYTANSLTFRVKHKLPRAV